MLKTGESMTARLIVWPIMADSPDLDFAALGWHLNRA
jgi:hypothetical protein